MDAFYCLLSVRLKPEEQVFMNEALKDGCGVVGLCPLRMKRARVLSGHQSTSEGALIKMQKDNTHALTHSRPPTHTECVHLYIYGVVRGRKGTIGAYTLE